MDEVLTKKDFVRRYAAGEFGNRPRTWYSPEDWWQTPELHDGSYGWSWNGPKLFHLRSKRLSNETYYNLTINQLLGQLTKVKGSSDDYYVSEMVNHSLNVIQGELQTVRGTLHLRYSLAPNLNMREAMVDGIAKTATNLEALAILQSQLQPQDYDWMQELRARYPGHVIEFGSFSQEVGVLQTKLIIWEVRLY